MILRSNSSTAKLIGGIIGIIILLIISAIRKSKGKVSGSGGSSTSSSNPPPATKNSSYGKVLENQKKIEEMTAKTEDDSIWQDDKK